MAATGYTPISLYYSTTAAAVPTNSNLVNGELAINITDGKLYYKDNAGVVKLLASNATSAPVTTFQTSLSGLTPATATSGAVTLAGTLGVASGGTGLTTLATGSLTYGAGTSAFSTLAIGTANQILTVNSGATAPQWSTLSGVAVTTFSAGTTGFTPSTATSGAVTLAGTLNVANGGTGLTTLTTGYIPYGNGTSAFNSSTGLTYSGSAFNVTGTGTFYSATATGQIFVGSNAGAYVASMNTGGTGNGLGYTTGELYFQNTNNVIAFANKASAGESMRISSAGYVGIGTNAPSVILDVTQSINASATIRLTNSNAGTSSSSGLNVSNGTSAGQFTIAGTSYGGYGAWLANETMAYAGTNLVLMADSGSGIIKFATGGNGEKMRISSAGLVGVGTTSATAMLQTAGSSSVAAFKTPNIVEVATVSATAATGTINYDITTQSVLYYTSNASANWTVNFRGSSGTSLNTIMGIGESMSATFMVTQGSTAYYNSAVQVDGTTSGVTTKWQGSAPTSGNASSIDVYTYVIIKTASATFTVLASQTKFA